MGVPASMTTAGSSTPTQTTTRQWILVFVLFLAGLLNSADRTSLSVAAPALSADLHITPVEMGFVLSSFFWTYSIGQIAAGWLLDRYSVKWVFAIGFVVWTAATFLTGIVNGIGLLLVLRFILGAGESVAFPAYSKIIASEFPPSKMGLPNAILSSGTKVGAALGILIGGLLIVAYGWRSMFFVLGGVGILFLGLWLIYAPDPPRKQREKGGSTASAGPSFMDILRTRDAWGTFIGQMGFTYAYFFGLTWLPTYLVQQRGISLAKMGLLGALPFWTAAIAAIVAAYVSDSLIGRGYSTTKIRKGVVVTGLVLSVAAYPSATVQDLTFSLILLNISYLGLGLVLSNMWAITQTFAGKVASGRWSGAQNCIGAVMGIIAPIASGYIVQLTGSYSLAFLVMAILALIGAASYIFIVGKVAPIDWDAQLAKR